MLGVWGPIIHARVGWFFVVKMSSMVNHATGKSARSGGTGEGEREKWAVSACYLRGNSTSTAATVLLLPFPCTKAGTNLCCVGIVSNKNSVRIRHVPQTLFSSHLVNVNVE